MLTLTFKKISPTHHEFTYTREDGTGETSELETKTFLIHDLIHFCLETEAGLKDSFYGKLEKGNTYAALNELIEKEKDFTEEVFITEVFAGALTGVVQSDASYEQLVAGVSNMLSARNLPLPAWFDEDFYNRFKEKFRKIIGEWKGTPFGATMELNFD
jgi:hypothetical protein